MQSNECFRWFCSGKSIEKKKDYKICVITIGDDPMVRHRIHYLGITDYYAKVHHKLEKFEEFKTKYNLQNEEILTMEMIFLTSK